MNEQVIKKELLFCWESRTLEVLVPKRHGAGFVKVPLGHHQNEALASVASKVRCDIYGLEGALSFQCGGSIAASESARAVFQAAAIAELERVYGWPAREIARSTFYELNPVTPR